MTPEKKQKIIDFNKLNPGKHTAWRLAKMFNVLYEQEVYNMAKKGEIEVKKKKPWKCNEVIDKLFFQTDGNPIMKGG